MERKKDKPISVCSVFGHNYNPDTGICIDCGDDQMLKSMKEQS